MSRQQLASKHLESKQPQHQSMSQVAQNTNTTTQISSMQRNFQNMSATNVKEAQRQQQRGAPQFSIPCAQPSTEQYESSSEAYSQQMISKGKTSNNNSSAAQRDGDDDFVIESQNFQSQNIQYQQDQFQLQQQAYQKMDQNMQGAMDDDNIDDMDPNGLIGVIKIKDGLFICDELGAQDLEFVVANKVTRVINCAGTQLRNFWEAIGVMYLTLNWQDDEKQTLFDSAEKIPEEIYRFMEEAVDNHESVMVQSVRAQNRACFVIATFVMRRYRWSLLKTLEFLNSRRPDLEMRPSFLAQLQQYEGRLYAKGIGPKTKRWNELADSNVPDLENDELILRNTYMNSQQGPLVDLNPPPGSQHVKLDRLVWRDLDKIQPLALCEENPDEEDLVNLINPQKQLNHYQKPAQGLKSHLKNSKLHAAQKRESSYGGRSQLSQNFLKEQAATTNVIPPRANSANSKSKFLTRAHNSGASSKQESRAQQAAEHQPQSSNNSNRTTQQTVGGSHAPSPSATNQQMGQNRAGHQPNIQHMGSSLFYPQPTFQQQKQATLQQKVLSQRPMSHQVRDVSPLNGQNLNPRVQQQQRSSANNGASATTQGGQTTHTRSGNSGQPGYVPFEPKKREMTQKIAPKMPFPMTQDLTNLPLPQNSTSEKQVNHYGKQSQNSAQSTNHSAPSKLLDRPKSSQVTSNSHGMHHQTSHQTKSGSMTGSGNQRIGTGASQQATRGISPSFHSKTGDLGVRNRGTLNSSFKRTAMTAHPPAQPAANGINMSGTGQDSVSTRPGSAPKMRTHTPNAENTSQLNPGSSLALRSQPSTQSTAGGLNSSLSLSKQMESNVQQTTSSKNMLNSFRNGPIKVMGNASHHINGASQAHKPRVSSSKFVNSSSHTTGAGRPASAPNKRPPSPNTSQNQHTSSNPGQSNGGSNSQNRVKYSKGTGSGGSINGQKSGVVGHNTAQTANQLRQGLNPMLRGYSPSKNRWKIATGTGTNTTGANRQNNASHQHGHHQHHGSATGSMHHGHSGSGSHFGGTNPNIYTRSTKHTPAHSSKV